MILCNEYLLSLILLARDVLSFQFRFKQAVYKFPRSNYFLSRFDKKTLGSYFKDRVSLNFKKSSREYTSSLWFQRDTTNSNSNSNSNSNLLRLLASTEKNDDLKNTPFLNALIEVEKELSSIHFFPGHQRGKFLSKTFREMNENSPFSYDLPELDGLDNIHNPVI